MRFLRPFLCLTVLLNGISILAPGGAPVVNAQQPSKPQSDDVLRIDTDLVQTAITVVDKNGHFVDGLDRGQFTLLVDGQPRPISFFERVTAGSSREEQLATRNAAGPPAIKTATASPTVRGRTIVFFIDDLHLSLGSLASTRQMLQHFLDTEMGRKDWVAITSPSGQIGFLQQFTNNKEVLVAALARLNQRPYDVQNDRVGNTVMPEYLALAIDKTKSAEDQVLNFYIGECLKDASTAGLTKREFLTLRAGCETQVKSTARSILMQAAAVTANTYGTLESLMRSSARLPGRKLAFFVSDGFLLDPGRGPALRDKLDQIIDAAQRAGVVVYTIDAKGLAANVLDATNNVPIDPNGRLEIATLGAIEATQDAMNALAEDTGGRALRNTNYFDRWVDKVLDETSNYYLLAWRPDKEEEKAPKFRHVKVTIAGHPELTVRAPRGYVEGPQPENPAAAAKEERAGDKPARTPEADLRDALSDYYPRGTLPTQLSLTFLNTPKNETVLTSSMQIASRGLNYGDDGKQPATIKLAGVILTDKGKIAASFKNQLSVNPLNGGKTEDSGIIYNQHTPLAPGIYQVRVAARDEKSGHVGSAMQWVVIPDLARHELTLSSVLLGGQVLENARNKDTGPQIQLSVDHRFSRLAHLGYWMFIYNAKRDATGAPNLTVQTQVLRDGHVMLVSPQRKVNQGGSDPERIPFGEELALQTLAPGSYDLRVTITDSIAGASFTQTIDFVVL
jgi:VWFA-related protein